MNSDIFERNYTRLLLLAVVIQVYRDMGFLAQIGVPLAALGYAWLQEWFGGKAERKIN